jgi:hypothetical protein|tara:strand:- start:52 stop:327 length:276 start_codon:yes stop_codon:yes gene_type:complete
MTLKEQIKDLKKQLEQAKKHTYIYESHTLQVWDGELHVGYGDLHDEKWLVWNVESLYKDLPFLVSQVKKENDKQQNMYGDLLRDSLKENER